MEPNDAINALAESFARASAPRGSNGGEQVLYSMRPHWAWLLRGRVVLSVGWFAVIPVVFYLLTLPGSPVVGAAMPWIALVCESLAIGSALGWAAKWYNTRYILTNQRVMKEWGVLGRYSTVLHLGQVSGTILSQTLVDRLVGAGRVGIVAAGGVVEQFSAADAPGLLRRKLDKMIMSSKNK